MAEVVVSGSMKAQMTHNLAIDSLLMTWLRNGHVGVAGKLAR